MLERDKAVPACSPRNPGGFHNTVLCSALPNKEIRIEQSQKSWRTIGGVEQLGGEALDIEPMRPLPQNVESFFGPVVVDGANVDENVTLVS